MSENAPAAGFTAELQADVRAVAEHPHPDTLTDAERSHLAQGQEGTR